MLATPSTLLYALGGYSGQNIQTTASAGSASFTQNNTFNGWTIGGGIETMLGKGWSTKFEYRYSQYESKTLPGTTLSLSPSTHAARVGLTYHFGGLGAAGPSTSRCPPRARRATGPVFYGGVAGGAGAMTDHLNASLGGASAAVDNGGQGLLGGFFAGADYQFAPQALVGVMGDYTWSGIQANSNVALGGTTATATTRQNNRGACWAASASCRRRRRCSTRRVAIRMPPSRARPSAAASSPPATTRWGGWTLGPGVEMMIADGWSTRLEYRYSQFAAASSNSVTGQASTQTVRAGLAYRFAVK